MNKQYFQDSTSQIGLFTFYKQQQQQEEISQRLKQNRKKKHKRITSKHKFNVQDSLQSPNKLSQKLNTKIADCDQFLKDVRTKQNKKMILTQISEKLGNYTQQQDHQIIEESVTGQLRKKSQKNIGLMVNKKISQIKLSKVEQKQSIQQPKESSIISAEIIRKKYFNNERFSLNSPKALISRKERVKQKIKTQINYKLPKNQLQYINSTERELILPRQVRQREMKSFVRTPIRSFQEKLGFLQITDQIKVASQRQSKILKGSKTSKELHEQNKRYFNNLMDNLYIQPEYNQTVYRILRNTLKFPEVSGSIKNLKTQQYSPKYNFKDRQIRSQSFYKNLISSSILKLKQKDKTPRNSLKVSVKGNLMTQIRQK